MKKYQNVGTIDSVVRLILGILILLIGYTILAGVFQTAAYLIAFILVATAITRICLIYKIFDISTRK